MMTRAQALASLQAAGYAARLILADDPESEDDAFALDAAGAVQVQIQASRDGLIFAAAVESGTGAAFAVSFGEAYASPVPAAADALKLAELEGVPC